MQEKKTIQLNLLPLEFRVRKKDITWILDRRVIWPIMLLSVALFVGIYLFFGTSEQINTINTTLNKVNAEIDARKPVIQKIRLIEKQLGEIEKKNKALQTIQVSKKRWIIIYENLNTAISPNMWFKKFEQKTKIGNEVDPNKMTLTGITHQFSEVAEYMVDLESFDSIDKVILKSIKTMNLSDGGSAFEFIINIDFNKYIGLDNLVRKKKGAVK